MKVKLLKDTRPFGRTGEIVEVSPEGREYLVTLGFAISAVDTREQVEIPEKLIVPTAVKAAPVKAAKAAPKKKESK